MAIPNRYITDYQHILLIIGCSIMNRLFGFGDFNIKRFRSKILSLPLHNNINLYKTCLLYS